MMKSLIIEKSLTIDELEADEMPAAVPELAAVLHACVQDGASIGFILPFSLDEAAGFWRGLIAPVRTGARWLLIARLEGRLAGTVQLVLGMPANGQHRAEIAKLLVHPAMRRKGIARVLIREAENLARRLDRSLLLLDTTQHGAAEPLYRSLGFEITGIVPGYACSTDGALIATTFMHKTL
jgi:GNAT superfamily N-acetyltransferase